VKRLILVVFVAALAASSPSIPAVVPSTRAAPASADAASVLAPTPSQLVGQKLMVAMSGTTPSAAILGRIQRGEIGGVVLFGANITTASQLSALTSKLQAAAKTGGQPSLLIATDQEGGSVKRVSWIPPTLSPPQMGSNGSASTAFTQGRETALGLEGLGINVDLAPVADVPTSTSSFMYQQGRTWSFSASLTATLSDAFASGLEAGGAVPTMKHFPGIGWATLNTDSHADVTALSKTALAPGLQPYQAAIAHRIPLVMLSNATYTAYDPANAAGWSHAISQTLLRGTLGFTGVSITDSLSGTAASRGVSPTSLAIKAAQAGTDMIMLTGSETSTAATYSTLLLDAQNGTIPTTALQSSYDRILNLKTGLLADGLAPSVHSPASALSAPSTMAYHSVPVRTTWFASDPSGIAQTSLEGQTSGGGWAIKTAPGSTATALVQSLAFGSTYRYAANATDRAGNTSGWAFGPTFEPLLSQQSSSSVTRLGAWTSAANSLASGGSLAYSTAAGASATFTFFGSSVAWVAYRGPNRGSAGVYIDGVLVRTVSLYSSVYAARQIAYATGWSANGAHTIRIVNLGTAGHPRVDVDAFVRLELLP
jgi:beta-N-acetylhexosaminidase